MGSSKEKIGVRPAKLDLIYTRGDDIYVTFDPFTLDGNAYPSGSTARLYAQDKNSVKNINAAGTFDPDSSGDDKRVTFHITSAENDTTTEYDYDIEVTNPSGDVQTHVIGTLTIEGDVN